MMWIYLALAAFTVFAAYLYRADFAKYSIFTVGVFKRVTRKPSESGAECTETFCETTVTDGEVRVAYKEIVVFGSVFLRYGGVKNHYCHDHTSFEFQNKDFEPSTVERLNETLLQAVVHFSAWTQLPEEDRDENVFDDVSKGVQTSFDLMGVAFIVLIASIAIVVAKNLTGKVRE